MVHAPIPAHQLRPVWSARVSREHLVPTRTPAVHDFMALMFLVGGSAVVHQRERFEVREGDAYLVPAGERHGLVAADSPEAWGVGFYPACFVGTEFASLLVPFHKAARGAVAMSVANATASSGSAAAQSASQAREPQATAQAMAQADAPRSSSARSTRTAWHSETVEASSDTNSPEASIIDETVWPMVVGRSSHVTCVAAQISAGGNSSRSRQYPRGSRLHPRFPAHTHAPSVSEQLRLWKHGAASKRGLQCRSPAQSLSATHSARAQPSASSRDHGSPHWNSSHAKSPHHTGGSHSTAQPCTPTSGPAAVVSTVVAPSLDAAVAGSSDVELELELVDAAVVELPVSTAEAGSAAHAAGSASIEARA